MLLHLGENAESSLMVGLEFYQRYLNEDLSHTEVEYYGNLKYAIIGIHNAVELYIKKLLSEVNDLLIYDVETIENPDILKYIGRKYKEKDKIHLDYFMASYGDKFTTISFTKCLTRFKALFDISDYDIDILTKINNYRNVITHFGLEDIFGQDKIVYTLNDTLTIINQKLFSLINVKKIFIEQELSDLINNFLNRNQRNFFEVWLASNGYVIEEYNNKIDEIIKQDKEFEDILGVKEYFEYDGEKLTLNGKNKNIELQIKDIPEKNISAIVFEEKVLAIMDYELYEEENTYVFCPVKDKSFNEIKSLKLCNWRDCNNHQYNKIPLNSKSFTNKILIKCLYLT